MIALTEDIGKLFNEVQHEISQNVRHMMEELWLNWSHLGVDETTKINNITTLVQIEKELHRDVISETRQKLKIMQSQVDKLKEETEELSRCLSVDISILEFKEDMMLVEYKRDLENQIAGYREQVEQRRMKMERLLEWQRDLAEKLGVTIQELQEIPLPSEEELDKLKDHLEVLQAERDKRAEIFLNTQVEIKDIMDKLQIKPQNKFEHLVVTSLSVDFKVTDLNMDRLAKLQQDLQEKFEQTNNRVLELRERLTKLWDCLEEDHIYRENFLQAHPGCHPHTENALKEEIRRCDQIKRQKIQVFVANVRTKIKLMWDNIMYSTQEREEFVHYFQDIFTEDTLTLHELYLEKITKFYNDHKNIFEMVMTRKNLWLKMTELEARATEPGRYHNRGGQLLKEEKERKAIASNLPKIEAQIRELVTEYEARTGNTFTVDGKPLLQLIQDEWETRKAERHNKLSARKQALTPTTPLFRSLATSPLGKRNRTAAGLAATAERNRPPAKRQLITGSATKVGSTISSNLSALKRSAISTVKRRISGRLATRAIVEGKGDHAKRKLDYDGEIRKTPKIAVCGNILKHKRTSHGRRSSSRRSMNATRTTASEHDDERHVNKDPLMETTLLTTYTDFKDNINEKQISRSSMATRGQEVHIPIIVYNTIEEKKTPSDTPKKTPRKKTPAPLTPKIGKENIQHVNNVMTPKNDLLCTPKRLTRSALKLNNDGFATPRAPLSANKVVLQRQNTATTLSLKTTPNNVNFDVGPTGRRFRRAIDGDRTDIESIINKTYTEKLFGDVDIGSLIELSTLSICMIDKNKDVIGFMALCDHPNVPGVSQVDWETWIRNMFQKYYLARNTLFIHFMCCVENVTDFFLEEAFIAIFLEDAYLLNIVLIVPPGCPEDCIIRYLTFKKRYVYKYRAKKEDENSEDREALVNCNFLYTAMRQDFCPKLRIRGAVEEDNDDIVAILNQKCPRLKEIYGDYYISEIIGRHPEINRKIIVADQQEHVVGVMCLNAELDYDNLQNTYELHPYYGLRKATPLEKEQNKRSNLLLKTFGEPILYGKWSPFDRTSKTKPKTIEDNISHENIAEPRSTKASSKVIFRHNSVTESSFDRMYFRKEISDDYSEKFYATSPTMSVVSNISVANLLDEDPFDYEIVNIDTRLLTVPRVLSNDYVYLPQINQTARQSRMIELESKLKRRTSLFKTTKVEELEKVKYLGGPNAFIIELFGLREDLDYRQAFDLLEAAFEAMKEYDYCVIRVPCSENNLPLLQHFCFVPTKPNICNKYALYIAHRNAVLGKLRVRKAELIDVPMIAQLLNTLDVKETMWTVEHTINKDNDQRIFVLLSGSSLVGIGVLEPTEQLHYIQTKYNLDAYHINKYHYKSHGNFAGFSALKTVLIYPVFEVHFRFFAREMMRLSECNTLVWLTAYRNKWVAHKANSLATVMIPLLPRKSEVDCTSIPDLEKINVISKNVESFSTWFISKKFTTIPKVNVDTRIVIVGASRTTMSFINALLFSDSCTYLTFNNVTLISPNGLPYVRHCKRLVESMFLKCRTNTDKYLKSVPYTYYVNVVQGTMAEIDRQARFVTLTNGSKYHYDLLFLLFGKQYQHPYYLKSLLNQEDETNTPVPAYIRLDVPKYPKEDLVDKFIPENVFTINNLSDANKALKYVKNNLLYLEPYFIIVYGATIHAYCCLHTLLEMGVPHQNIIFIEPFPPENTKKTRVSLFANSYVDRTVKNILDDLKIKVYRSYHFQSWNCDYVNMVSSINILSYFKMVQLPCSALFFYGTQGVDEAAFVAINKSGIAYNKGILIDHQFRTKDSAIYAAGPATRYNSNYYADDKQQTYFDSYEVGTKLGEQIRNQLDPFFANRNAKDQPFATEDDSILGSASTASKSAENYDEIPKTEPLSD